jgi:hypothetical protein
VAMRSRSTRPRASRPSDPPRSIDLDSLIKLAENLASHATDTRPTTHSPAPVSPRAAGTDPSRVRKHATTPDPTCVHESTLSAAHATGSDPSHVRKHATNARHHEPPPITAASSTTPLAKAAPRDSRLLQAPSLPLKTQVSRLKTPLKTQTPHPTERAPPAGPITSTLPERAAESRRSPEC